MNISENAKTRRLLLILPLFIVLLLKHPGEKEFNNTYSNDFSLKNKALPNT